MGPEDEDDKGGGGAACDAYRNGSESYMDNLRGYAATPSGPLPSVHIHPGKGQCALCGRWFCRSIKDTNEKEGELSAKYDKGVEWKMMRFTKMIATVFEGRYLL